jgi:hypothetical protein
MTTTHHPETSTNGSDVAAAAKDVASTVADRASAVADRASAAAARLPDAANATGVQLGRANERIQTESDEVLTVGTALSLGLALGLLLGGANRILVFLALMPAAAMGYTLFDRHNGSRGVRSR